MYYLSSLRSEYVTILDAGTNQAPGQTSLAK